MIEFKITKKRWQSMLDAVITLAGGKMGQTLKIYHKQDTFESLESIFNLMNEELTERLLHLSFIKPNDFQKYLKHYVLLIDKDLKIKNCCDAFLSDFSFKINHIKNQSLEPLLDVYSFTYLKHFCSNISIGVEMPKPNLMMFDDSFTFNINSFDHRKMFIVHLYQLSLNTRSNLHSETSISNHIKIKQRKRYETIIEEVKMYIDNFPLHQKLTLKHLSLHFGINLFMLKKMFKEQYQCSVYEYFITLRMKHAYLLIETGTLAFKEIAYMVGYSEYSSFVKYFKKYYDILPKQVRLKAQKEN